jgi:TldD protein
VLFHEACGHGLEADLVAKGASVFAGRRGERVASPLVTLVDDGTVSEQWGTSAIDDEGHPASRNVLIEDGVLTGYMRDLLRGRKEGDASSGNGRRQSYRHLPMVRMTNTFLLAGEDDPDDIVASTERGVFVARLGGGQVNTATGDFVFGMAESYLIEDGRITAPLREGNLIGNCPEVGLGQPTLRVAAITVGGTAR